jgi:hypothetical protein
MTHPISGTGDACFQLPAPLIDTIPTRPLDGTARRVLAFLLWEAHRLDRWPGAGGHAAPIAVELPLADIRTGAGLEAAKDYRAVCRALDALARTGLILVQEGEVVTCPILCGWTKGPGLYAHLTLSDTLAALHARPLDRYALINIVQMRDLKKPADLYLYARACLVARQRRPVFELPLVSLARMTGLPGEEWGTLRRPLIGACRRVAARTGIRFRLQAWCSGRTGGIDTLRVEVAADPTRRWLLLRSHYRAIHLEIDATGVRPFEPGSAGIMDVFRTPKARSTRQGPHHATG